MARDVKQRKTLADNGYVIPRIPIIATAERFSKSIMTCEMTMIVGFLQVVGVVDGTQIKIKGPTHNEPDYVNRKGFHSLNVQVICDAKFRIRNVVAKWPGSVHDSRIFRDSQVCQEFDNDRIDGILLGDSGYPCRPYLLTPFLNPATPRQERYNEALVKTRMLIEQTFGILERRFSCLSYGLRLNPEKSCKIIVACAIFHNFGQDRGDILCRYTDETLMPPCDMQADPTIAGARYRDLFVAQHFA